MRLLRLCGAGSCLHLRGPLNRARLRLYSLGLSAARYSFSELYTPFEPCNKAFGLFSDANTARRAITRLANRFEPVRKVDIGLCPSESPNEMLGAIGFQYPQVRDAPAVRPCFAKVPLERSQSFGTRASRSYLAQRRIWTPHFWTRRFCFRGTCPFSVT